MKDTQNLQIKVTNLSVKDNKTLKGDDETVGLN